MLDIIRQRFQRNEEPNENTIFVDNVTQINNYLQNKVVVTVPSLKNNWKILIRLV